MGFYKKIKDNEKIVLLLILIFALFLRTYNLENFPRWYCDEGSNTQIGINLFKGVFGYETWGPNFFPPLLDFLVGLFIFLFGKTYFIAKLIGVITGSLSVLLLYFIGKKLYSKFVGISAALLFSIGGLYINRMVFQDNLTVFFFLLTIFSYIKFKEDRNDKWIYFSGLFAGLSFLSKYTGLISILFLILQSFYDKKFKAIIKGFIPFLLICLIYPILGIIFGWQEFLFDIFYQTSRELSNDFIKIFTIQAPYYDLNPSFFNPYHWTLLGVVSIFYLIYHTFKNKTKNNILILISFVSIFLVSIIARHVWWVYIILIYPSYFLAFSLLLRDALLKRKFGSLDLLFLICVILMLKWKMEFIILTISSFSILLILKIKYRKIVTGISTFFSLFIIFSLIFFSYTDIVKIFQNENEDLKKATNFINNNTENEDMIASNPDIMWLFKGKGIDYAQMAFYSTKEYTYIHPIELYPRFKMNVSFDKFKFIVLDYPKWLKYKLGESKSVNTLTPVITSKWNIVFKEGNVSIYKNPAFNKTLKKNIISTQSNISYR